MSTSKKEFDKESFVLICQMFYVSTDIATACGWNIVQDIIVIESFKEIVKFCIGLILVRIFFVFISWALTETPLIYIYVAVVTIGLLFDIPVMILACTYYKQFFSKQLKKLTDDLQITDSNEDSGIAFGGFVLLEGEYVCYCDSQEYVTRAKKIAVLQAREMTLRTEQHVLKGEDVEEDEMINRPRQKNGDCQISIEICGSEPASSGLGEMEPPGGFYACDEQFREYVLLEDCRTAHREIANMEQRLEALRAENRVLRDAIKREMKGERAVVEPKDEKNIDDVD